MARKGQILENPLTGDSYEFLETSKDTNGERMTVKMTVKSQGKLVPDHIHTLQDERFEVLSGKLSIMFDHGTQLLSEGDEIELPKNVPHNHYNNSDEVVVFKHTVSPALDFEYVLETLVGLAVDGKISNGKAGFVQELVILKYTDGKTFLAKMPISAQKILMNIVGPIGRIFGYRAVYKKYSEIEK